MCGETPPWSAARRTASASRRRTSEVLRRRPVLDRNSAGSGIPGQQRPPALQPGPQRAPRGLARGHDARTPALALHPQLLGVGVQAGQVQVHQLLGTQPGGVAQLEDRPVAQLQRRGAGHALQQLAQLAGLEHGGQVGLALGAGDQVRGAGLHPPGAHQRGVEGADRGQLARDGGARHPPFGQHAGEAPQLAEVQLLGVQGLGPGPLAQLGQVDPVGRAGLLGQALAAHGLVEAAQRGGPTRLERRDFRVLHQHSGRSGGHAVAAGGRRAARRRLQAGQAAGTRSRGRARPRPCGTR